MTYNASLWRLDYQVSWPDVVQSPGRLDILRLCLWKAGENTPFVFLFFGYMSTRVWLQTIVSQLTLAAGNNELTS